MSRWKDDKVFNFGRVKVHSTKAKAKDPVRWYLELELDGSYWFSYGSKMPLRFLAAVEAWLRRPRYPHD